MRRSEKSKAEMEDFIRFTTSVTAPLTVDVAPQEKARKRVVNKLNKMIASYMQGKQMAEELPLGEMLFVRALARVYSNPDETEIDLKKVDMIITPLTINSDSVRCILWTQQFKSWETRQIDRGILESKRAIKFKDILAWRRWTTKDAALTVNHLYQTPAYKRRAYGV